MTTKAEGRMPVTSPPSKEKRHDFTFTERVFFKREKKDDGL